MQTNTLNACNFFYSASVSLYLLERNKKFTDIDCPGDTLTYNCSIPSNSESIQLIWNITQPGKMPIGITYNSTSILNNIDYLDANISTLLTEYREEEYIESVLTLTILSDFILNGTIVKCSFSSTVSRQTIVFINTSGMNAKKYSLQVSMYNVMCSLN